MDELDRSALESVRVLRDLTDGAVGKNRNLPMTTFAAPPSHLQRRTESPLSPSEVAESTAQSKRSFKRRFCDYWVKDAAKRPAGPRAFHRPARENTFPSRQVGCWGGWPQVLGFNSEGYGASRRNSARSRRLGLIRAG